MNLINNSLKPVLKNKEPKNWKRGVLWVFKEYGMLKAQCFAVDMYSASSHHKGCCWVDRKKYNLFIKAKIKIPIIARL